jgi:hypothetical protein
MRRARPYFCEGVSLAALHMLRSTVDTVSAPASSSFRGSLPYPTQPLFVFRRHPRLTQHSLPGGSLGLTWPDLHRLIAPALPGAFHHSTTSSANVEAGQDWASCGANPPAGDLANSSRVRVRCQPTREE